VDELSRLFLQGRDGDRVALATWIRRSQVEVWRLCAHLVDVSTADDLTQEVFLRAHQAMDRFRGDSSVRTWLLAIARNVCADAVRRRQRSRRYQGHLIPAESHDLDGGRAEVDDLLDRLDPDRRVAFVLTQLIGLSYLEAAEVCGCPVGTIRSRVARARTDLIEAIGEPEAGEAGT
jgi:RNA polymerase sigma-70 factor (ECF subfamily)